MNEKPIIFLDRDGVLTEEKGYVCKVEDLVIFPYAKETVKKIHEKGYYAIVVTNQSGVGRGYFTENELLKMNSLLIHETGVDAVYYCPHYTKGIVKRYAVPCNCRKPGIEMIEKACKDFFIDDVILKQSYMVGDRASDIKMGQNAGIKTVLLESGYGTARLEEMVVPDYIYKDLKEFVNAL